MKFVVFKFTDCWGSKSPVAINPETVTSVIPWLGEENAAALLKTTDGEAYRIDGTVETIVSRLEKGQ